MGFLSDYFNDFMTGPRQVWGGMNKVGETLNPFYEKNPQRVRRDLYSTPVESGSSGGGNQSHAPLSGVNGWLDYSGLKNVKLGQSVEETDPTTASIYALLKQMGAGGGGGNAGAPYDSQINELRRQLAMAQGLNNQGKQDVKVGFDALANYWAKDVPKNFKRIYKDAKSSTKTTSDKLRAAVAGNFEDATAGSAEQMKKFGIDTGPMGQQAASQIVESNASKQGQLQGLADSRTAANKDFFDKMNASAGSFANKASGLTKNQKERSLGELRQQLYNTTMGTQGKISDLARERGAAVARAAQENSDRRLSALLKLRELQASSQASPADVMEAARKRLGLESDQVGQGPGAALAYLRNAATRNGQLDQKKFTDLMNEYNYISSSRFNEDLFGKGSDRRPEYGDYSSHLVGAAQRRGAGQDYIESILNALGIAQGKYKANDYGY